MMPVMTVPAPMMMVMMAAPMDRLGQLGLIGADARQRLQCRCRLDGQSTYGQRRGAGQACEQDVTCHGLVPLFGLRPDGASGSSAAGFA
jgi:hypothetical protein